MRLSLWERERESENLIDAASQGKRFKSIDFQIEQHKGSSLEIAGATTNKTCEKGLSRDIITIHQEIYNDQQVPQRACPVSAFAVLVTVSLRALFSSLFIMCIGVSFMHLGPLDPPVVYTNLPGCKNE